MSIVGKIIYQNVSRQQHSLTRVIDTITIFVDGQLKEKEE